MHRQSIATLDAAVRRAIARRELPGAVLDIAHRGRTLVRKAFGWRSVVGKRERMTLGTIFDLASLTKVVATTSAAALLVDEGEVALHTRAGKFLPKLNRGRKRGITIEHLLTHCSGLPAHDNYLAREPAMSPQAIVADICAKKLDHPPGEAFAYSDLGFILLGKIVEAVADMTLDEFCHERVFGPLGMKNTRFDPPATWRGRCAPTARRRGKMLRGEVHDENAFALGRVAGHAGLFSTVGDLRRFADMLLAEGWTPQGRFLRAETVREFLRPRRLPDGNARALGFDVDTAYSSPRGHVFPVGSLGHTGFTGTSMWIDPSSQTSVILLSNRVHPDDEGDAKPLRARVASIAAALAERSPTQYAGDVETGLDALVRDEFAALHGRRVGLVANHTAIDKTGRHMLDHLLERDDVEVKAIFSPEHGFEGKLDAKVASSRLAGAGLPIHSLYGEHVAPTPEMLDGIDALVFDIQDIGTRFYTYAATMGLCMKAAAAAGIRFVVLDRPNPINGIDQSGPVLRRSKGSFVAYHPVPLRHGLSMGELARLANARLRGLCDLEVVRAQRWRRAMFFDETGLPWVNPSPNMRNLKQAILYPAIGAVEFANVSVGRGTDTPFEVVGAPWIDAGAFADRLNRWGLPGLSFTPITFEPRAGKFQGERCRGVYIMLDHRTHFRADLTTLAIAQTLWQLYGRQFEIGKLTRLVCDAEALAEIRKGIAAERIAARWQAEVAAFRDAAREVWLYS